MFWEFRRGGNNFSMHFKSFMEALVCELDAEELVRFTFTLFKIITIM